MIPLSSIATSACTDLVRLLKDEALSGVAGKPTLKARGDKGYWYAARRVGTEMRFIYIGEDSDETRARIDRIEELRATARDRQAERSRRHRKVNACAGELWHLAVCSCSTSTAATAFHPI